MLTEQIQQNKEKPEQLFDDTIALEKGEVSPEYLPMWNAENKACFPHFLNYASDELAEVLFRSKNGDIEAIETLGIAYQEYRAGLESDMSLYAPNIYDLFIEAVSRGDETNAATFVEEYISLATAETPKEDDEDDD